MGQHKKISSQSPAGCKIKNFEKTFTDNIGSYNLSNEFEGEVLYESSKKHHNIEKYLKNKEE